MPPISNHEHPDHGILSWTECESENCVIHREDKDIKRQRIDSFVNEQSKLTRPSTPYPPQEQPILEEGEILESENEAESVNSSTSEESDDDSTDDEIDEEDWNYVQFAAEASKPILKILRHLALGHKDVFPVINGKTYLHPFHFDLMFNRIRTAFWNHRLVPMKYDAKTFVQERPPIGSDFTGRGYLVPDGTFVNASMRGMVGRMKTIYEQVHIAQTTAMERMTEEEYNDDKTRFKHTTEFLNNSFGARNLQVPPGWRDDYIHTLSVHGYPSSETIGNMSYVQPSKN